MTQNRADYRIWGERQVLRIPAEPDIEKHTSAAVGDHVELIPGDIGPLLGKEVHGNTEAKACAEGRRSVRQVIANTLSPIGTTKER